MDNRKEKIYPSERWARGKKFGILVNVKLQKHLIKTLGEAGHKAMAPCTPSHWSEQMSEKYGRASTWSERHAAYAAGLGTFGLCDGLITSVGKAMRCGSIVAQIAVPPTKRPYERHTEYCLFLSEGTCGMCMARCPVGAITEKGHDKEKCRAHCDGICTEYAKTHFNIDINVCGLCQTKVPCESGIPRGRVAGNRGYFKNMRAGRPAHKIRFIRDNKNFPENNSLLKEKVSPIAGLSVRTIRLFLVTLGALCRSFHAFCCTLFMTGLAFLMENIFCLWSPDDTFCRLELPSGHYPYGDKQCN